MSRLQQLLATAIVAAFTFGAAQAVSAAPVMHAVAAPVAAESHTQATPVYYVWRHHHRVWVGRHHR